MCLLGGLLLGLLRRHDCVRRGCLCRSRLSRCLCATLQRISPPLRACMHVCACARAHVRTCIACISISSGPHSSGGPRGVDRSTCVTRRTAAWHVCGMRNATLAWVHRHEEVAGLELCAWHRERVAACVRATCGQAGGRAHMRQRSIWYLFLREGWAVYGVCGGTSWCASHCRTPRNIAMQVRADMCS